MNKWKEISDSRKSKEGFGGVSYEDVWNLDTRLASIISVHLHAFLKASKSTPRGFPGIIGSANTEQGHQEWLKIIRKMIYAFDTYSGAYPFSIPGLQSAVRSAKIGSF